jgi:hypothetical protein
MILMWLVMAHALGIGLAMEWVAHQAAGNHREVLLEAGRAVKNVDKQAELDRRLVLHVVQESRR